MGLSWVFLAVLAVSALSLLGGRDWWTNWPEAAGWSLVGFLVALTGLGFLLLGEGLRGLLAGWAGWRRWLVLLALVPGLLAVIWVAVVLTFYLALATLGA